MRRTKRRAVENPWDAACKLVLQRHPGAPMPLYPFQNLDPGVNFFVLALEAVGAETLFSCDGHDDPYQFYISFKAPYETARLVSRCGFFNVTISCLGNQHEMWRLSLPDPPTLKAVRRLEDTLPVLPKSTTTGTPKECVLRWAATSWVKGLRLSKLVQAIRKGSIS